jgi:hypothetical protein
MCTLFGVVIVMGGYVLSDLLVNDVVVASGRFLGSVRVVCVGSSTVVVIFCGDMLLGKRVIVWLESWHACCR